MSLISDIIKIPSPLDYKAPCIVGTDHDKFFEYLKSLPENYLNEKRTFALLFDLTPLDNLKDMKDYHEISDYFKNKPNGDRVFDKAFYIGNVDGDKFTVIEQILDHWKLKCEVWLE